MEFTKNGMYIAEYLKPIYRSKNINISWGGGSKTFDLKILWAEHLKEIKPCLFNIPFKRLVKWALPYGFVRLVQKMKNKNT